MKSIVTTIGDIFRVHGIAILVGVAMALLVASPHIRAITSIGVENFRGVYPLFSDDEVTYLARIQEVREGNMALGNPYIKEHMDDPFIMPPIAEWVFASLSWLTGTSVPFIMSVSDGVFGFASFLLIYILFQTLTKSMWISLVYTVVFMFFSLATFGRPISPQFNALFLFAGLITIVKIYFNPGLWNRKWNLIAGLITGITCFISPYYFTALLGFYTLVFLSRAVWERSVESIKKNAPWFFLSFLPLALVYAFFQIKAAQDPAYSETVLRYGLMHTHIPGSFTNVLFAVLAGGVLMLCIKSLQNQKFAFVFGSLATVVALNWQNILTGKSLQFSSHYLFTSILLIFISFALIHAAFALKEMVNLGRVRKSLIVLSMVFLVLVIGYNQKDEYMNLGKTLFSKGELLEEQKRMDVFNWFNEHSEADSVVYTLGDGYDFLLPVYTHNKVFYNFYAALYPAFDIETEERWVIQHLFDEGVSSSTIRDSQRDFWGNKYIDSYQSKQSRKKIASLVTGKSYDLESMIPEDRVAYMYSRWRDIQLQPHTETLGRYAIDYILVSKDYPHYAKAVEKLERIGGVSLVTEIQGNRIYWFQ